MLTTRCYPVHAALILVCLGWGELGPQVQECGLLHSKVLQPMLVIPKLHYIATQQSVLISQAQKLLFTLWSCCVKASTPLTLLFTVSIIREQLLFRLAHLFVVVHTEVPKRGM